MEKKKEYFDFEMREAKIIHAMLTSARDKIESADDSNNDRNEGLWLLEGAIEKIDALADKLDKQAMKKGE